MAKRTMTRHAGRLVVYRDSSQRETLTAVLAINGVEHYWHTAPKCFVDAIDDGRHNLVDIEVDLDDNMSYPRNVKVTNVVPR